MTTRLERVLEARSQTVAVERVLLHHYVTKSLQEFQMKMRRGTGMGMKKTIEFFNHVHSQATAKCLHALHLGR